MAVNYIDNRELQLPGRLEILLLNAETPLDSQAPLSRDDEVVLFRAMHACGYALNHLERGRAANRSSDQLKVLRQRICDELIKRNTGLIYDMRRRTRVTGVDVEDLMSEGLWTLYKSVASFDPWRGFRFSTYACTAILRGFLMLGRRAARRLKQAKFYGEQLVLMRNQDGDRTSDIEIESSLSRLRSILDDNQAGLTPTERYVLERRLLHDPGIKPDTLESIGEEFNLSKERIRQIQVRAIGKLRGVLEGPTGEEAEDCHLATCA